MGCRLRWAHSGLPLFAHDLRPLHGVANDGALGMPAPDVNMEKIGSSQNHWTAHLIRVTLMIEGISFRKKAHMGRPTFCTR
jgi:hypothetical protein